jgi:hypothetical protein
MSAIQLLAGIVRHDDREVAAGRVVETMDDNGVHSSAGAGPA